MKKERSDAMNELLAMSMDDEHIEQFIQATSASKSNERYIQYMADMREHMSMPHHDPRTSVKISRNAPCFCGSGKKYKKCCINEVN